MAEEARGEAYVSAERPTTREASRVPASHVRSGRTTGDPVPPAQGSAPPVSLIWRIGDKATFAAFRRAPRARVGPITVSVVAPAVPTTNPPAVAFAVGRRVGGAVVRNKVRRRLRAIARDNVDDVNGLVRGHFYLVAVRPGIESLSYGELTRIVQDAVRRSTVELARRAQASDRRSERPVVRS